MAFRSQPSVIQVSLNVGLSPLFDAYFTEFGLGEKLYYNFDLSAPIASQTLYGVEGFTSLTTDASATITGIII
jgi:hypothetical protein